MILRMIGFRIFCFVCFMLSLATLPVCGATEEDELAASRERLAALEQQIETTLSNLRDKRSAEGNVDRDLAALQQEIRRVQTMVQRSAQELESLESAIASRHEAVRILQEALQRNRRQIEKRLVALYKTGDVGLLRILFSEDVTPATLAEKYTILARLVRHDQQLLAEYRLQTATEQRELSALESLRLSKQAIMGRHRAQQQTLEAAQATKHRLLQRLREDQQQLDRNLADLQARAARLNDLVKKLESEQLPSYTEGLAGLSAGRGRFPWPVDGPIRVEFGTRRDSELGSLIDSKGLEIGAAPGTSVTAIAVGRVLYAKSLRGYGRLLIVDHGGKDYSLYAHLANFAKAEGDSVAAGEPIGRSGFDDRDYIYFEIRHGGQPLDPLDWLQPR